MHCVAWIRLRQLRLVYIVTKYPYIDGYFLASFPYFNGTDSYTFVCDGIMKLGPTLQCWAWASLYCQFTDTHVYGTGCVKTWKTRHEISVDIRIFFCSVQRKIGLPFVFIGSFRRLVKLGRRVNQSALRRLEVLLKISNSLRQSNQLILRLVTQNQHSPTCGLPQRNAKTHFSSNSRQNTEILIFSFPAPAILDVS